MKYEKLKARQTPLKEKYRSDPAAVLLTLYRIFVLLGCAAIAA
ncbi:MAG: hypothetical protein Q7J84_03325 [Sulfuricaulis sp.]|nr:hypothetical protein [Sulfuricaulis sp.]